jgi:hypothetical protein
MLAQHLHGEIALSEPTATLLHHWLPGDAAMSACRRSKAGAWFCPAEGVVLSLLQEPEFLSLRSLLKRVDALLTDPKLQGFAGAQSRRSGVFRG